MNSLKIHAVTIGCDKNLVDSEVLIGKFKNRGILPASSLEDADIWLLNTCGFIDAARKDSFNEIERLCSLKEDRVLIVVGCLSQEHSKAIAKDYPEVDHIAGVGDYESVVESIFAGQKNIEISLPNRVKYSDFDQRELLTPSHIAFVKISEGCNFSCAFCRIPRIRGAQQSRSIEDISAEVLSLANTGVKEIVLVSQNSSDYGRDNGETLLKLVQSLSKIDNIIWIRLLYLYPGLLSVDELKEIFLTEKVVPYLDMPIQHASSEILRNMNRPFNIESTLKMFKELRESIPEMALRTTVLLGFPGEEEEDVELVADFMSEVCFDHLGTYRYSPEEGTAGANLELTVDQEEVIDREARLMDLQNEHSLQRQLLKIGQEELILIDSIEPAENWSPVLSELLAPDCFESDKVAIGRTRFMGYDIDGVVLLNPEMLKAGDLVKAEIKNVTPYDIFAVQIVED